MKMWYVTVAVEETLCIHADTEQEAVSYAMSDFDPTAHDYSIKEVWSEEDEYDDNEDL